MSNATLRWPLSPGLLAGELLVTLARQRQSGRLQWQGARGMLRLEFREGRPIMYVDADGNATSTRAQVVTALRQFALTTKGDVSFESAASPGGPSASHIDTMGETLLVLVSSFPEDFLGNIWQERGTKIVEQTTSYAKLAAAARKVGGVEIPEPQAGLRLADWAANLPLRAQRTALAIVVLGGLRGAAASVAIAAAPRAAGGPGDSEAAAVQAHLKEPPKRMRTSPLPADPALRLKVLEIDKTYSCLGKKTHYELLGVDSTVLDDALRKRYFELAKEWHADNLRVLGLSEDVITMSEEVFAALSEAFRIISNAEERQAYDFVLDRQSKGLPTDPRIIMEAEGLFQKAKILVRRGQAPAAEPLLRQAVELNKGEPEFLAYWGYAIYCAQGSAGFDDGAQKIKQALAVQPKMSEAFEFLGRMHRAEGRQGEAVKNLKTALELKPNNKEVEFELRLLGRRAEKKGSDGKLGLGSLLGKFLKR